MTSGIRQVGRWTLSVVAVLAVVMAGFTTRGQAASEPDKAEAILKAASDHYASLKVIRFRATVEKNIKIAGVSQSEKVGFDFTAERPNRFSMKPALADQPIQATIVSDGATLTHLVPELGRYSQADAPADLDEIAESMEFIMMSGGIGQFLAPLVAASPHRMFTESGDAYSYIGTKEHGGKTYDVVRRDNATMPFDYWFTPGEKPLLERVVPDISAQLAAQRAAGGDIEAEIVFAISDFKAEGELPADAFALVIPEGTEKTDSILGSGAEPNALAEGAEAPAFELEQLGGEKVSLASHKGKDVVILDFWATWCGPCRTAMPIIDQVADSFKGKNVVLYAVNLQEADEDVRAFLTDEKLEVNVLMDRTGRVGQDYGAMSIPMTVIIDKAGLVHKVHVGYSPALKSQLTRELNGLTGAAN